MKINYTAKENLPYSFFAQTKAYEKTEHVLLLL